MEIKISPTRTMSARSIIKEWIMQAQPSDQKAFVFDDKTVKASSKRSIVSQLVNTTLKSKGFKTRARVEKISRQKAKELKLEFVEGYEPVLVWILKKEKKQ